MTRRKLFADALTAAGIDLNKDFSRFQVVKFQRLTKYGGRSASLAKIRSAVHLQDNSITAHRRQNNGV